MLVCRLKESVFCRSWICYHITQPLSQYPKIFRRLILKPASALFGLQLGKGRADLRARSRQIIPGCILPHKYTIGELPPEIILNETFADYNITEKNVFARPVPKGCATANSDHQSKLNPRKAGTKASCCRCGSNFSHVRHVHQNDIVVSDHAS